MSVSPHQLAELARAALAWDCTATNPPSHAEEQYWKFRAATRNPLVWLALVERLRLASAAIPDYSQDFPASSEYMNRPLDTPPENAKQ